MKVVRGICFALSAGLLTLIAGAGLAEAAAQQPSEAEKEAKQQQLAEVQKQIEKRLQALEQRRKKLTETEQELKQLEQKTAQLASQLRQTRQQQQRLEQRIAANRDRQQQLQDEQKQQAEWLQKQVVSAYTNGEHDFLKLLLNQQDPAAFERLLSYYQYFNQARIEQIEQIKAIAAELKQLEQSLQQQSNQLTELRQQQQSQRQQLTQQQARQESAIARMQQQQRDDKQRLQSLQQNREQLEQVIAAIEAALQTDVQLVGLRPVKGQLNWPTQGRVRQLFGQRREGPLRWKGVLIDGDNSQPVHTIADGRIVFADWLRGFGLVIVVDHGEGYMSLYGHNQTLLKSVGDEVKRGNEIALMGQSGGRSSASLYFEIRHQGKAENPAKWIN